MPLKITTWNVEWADTLVEGTKVPAYMAVPHMERREPIYKTLCEIDPDILCMVEGPEGEKRAKEFSQEVFHGDWIPVFLGGGGSDSSRKKQYSTRGHQWIWFFVKPEQEDRVRLQPPAVWQEKNGCKAWSMHLWGRPYEEEDHGHYRHPQVLVCQSGDGREMELIGIHLKSGYMNTGFSRDAEGNISLNYLTEALTNRIKLATEARNVRDYVSKRFLECREGGDGNPAMIILGDANDGPGQDFFEEKYLFFSVISNLEGSVLDAEEYFNHALFDFDPERCWSARFNDPVIPRTADENPLLLDHILMSQPLCDGSFPLRANRHAGRVEHEAWEKYSGDEEYPASDHRPVSITLK